AFYTHVQLTRPSEFERFVGLCECMSSLDKESKVWVFRGAAWVRSGMGHTLYNHNIAINKNSCFNKAMFFEGAWTATSRHSSGTNLLFADGHIQFMRDSVALSVWRAIGTRAGGESISGLAE